jgi:hypothetical protein
MCDDGDYYAIFCPEELARAKRACRAGAGGPPPVEARVRRGSRWHRIVLTRSGRLSLRDHTKEAVRRYFDYQQVGGELCPCVAVLSAWRRFVRDNEEEAGEGLPEALRQAGRGRHGIGFSRRLSRCEQHDDLSVRPSQERPGVLARKINDLIRREWKVPGGITCRVMYKTYVRDGFAMLQFFKTGGRFLRHMELQRDWFGAVYRRELAVHEGHLVVRVTVPDKGRLFSIGGADFIFYRCRPMRTPHRCLQIEEDCVAVARGPAGDFRVVRRLG